MNRNAICKGLAVAAAGVALWACMTWPLALHVRSAIAYTPFRARNVPAVQALTPSDNLQLMYHFWLCRDMIAGHTPAFSNIYEFNTGDDAAMRSFSPYYVPFSLVFAAVSPIAGNAAGWNVALLASLLLGFWGLFALSRRFASSFAAAFAAALVAGAFPFIWINAMIGSPTGFALCLVPWLLYGIDVAVREQRAVGGLVAGLAIIAAFCSDLHVFYFSALVTPVWTLIAFSMGLDRNGREAFARRLSGAVVALLPFAALAVVALLLSRMVGAGLKTTTMAAGRTLQEVRNCSPVLRGLVSWQPLGYTNHIFFGSGLIALLALGAVSCRRAVASGGLRKRDLMLLAAMLAAMVAVILLANGAYGPFGGMPIRVARKLVPKYTMIRQSTKVFCLMPSLVAIFLSLAFSAMKGRLPRLVASLVAIAAIAEQATWLRPSLCTTPDALPAYNAAAEYAYANGIGRPHALCVPLWPGESHYSSLYEYGVIGTRIRLLNGYSPSVPGDYFADVFSKLESVNGGVLTEDQRSFLSDMGINLIIFHEQPYPQKVSPFTSHVALEKLRANPALKEVASTDGIFVFAMTGAVAEVGKTEGSMLGYPAAMHWRASRLLPVAEGNGPYGVIRPVMRSPAHFSDGVSYMMLLSGGGTLTGALGTVVEVPDSPEWVSVPFLPPIGEKFTVTAGSPMVRHALIVAGAQTHFEPGSSHTWRACEFFHQGYSDEADGSVSFDQSRNCADVLLFGPDLPFPKGRYTATLRGDFRDGDAFSAETIGDGGATLASAAIDGSADECTIDFDHDGMLPLRLSYRFCGSGASRVKTISIQR